MNDHLFTRRDVPRSQSLTNVPAGEVTRKRIIKSARKLQIQIRKFRAFVRVSWLRRERKENGVGREEGEVVEAEISSEASSV